MPGLAEVDFYNGTEKKSEEIFEVRSDGLVGEIVALPLHDVTCEVRGRICGGVLREEPHVSYEQAADHRVLAARDRRPPVAPDTSPHLLQAADPIGFAEQFPGFRHLQPGGVAEEPAAHHPVVRVVGLEEERLAWSQYVELATTARLPEVNLQLLRAGREEAVPLIVGDTDLQVKRSRRVYRVVREWPPG